MKSITFPQALVLIACMGAPIAAYKLLDSPEAAAAGMVIGMVVNFLLGRESQAPVPASSGIKLVR